MVEHQALAHRGVDVEAEAAEGVAIARETLAELRQRVQGVQVSGPPGAALAVVDSR